MPTTTAIVRTVEDRFLAAISWNQEAFAAVVRTWAIAGRRFVPEGWVWPLLPPLLPAATAMEGMFRLAEGVRAMQREFTQTLLGAGRPAVPAAVTGEAAPRVTAVEQARVLERARQEQQAAEVQARKAQAEAAQARKALAAAERRAAEAERREEGTLELAVALEKTIRELQQEVGELQHEREAAEPARRAAKHTAKETGRSERARQKEPIRQTGRPPDEAEATTPATPQAEAERTPGAAVDVPSEGSR